MRRWQEHWQELTRRENRSHTPRERSISAKKSFAKVRHGNCLSQLIRIIGRCLPMWTSSPQSFFVLPRAAHSNGRDIACPLLNAIQAFVVRLIFVGCVFHSLLSVFETSFRHRKNNSIVLSFDGFVKFASSFGAGIGFLSLQA